jgi:ParB/RepB/Spo0J family partition protein
VSVRELAREYREVPHGLIDPPELPSRSEMDEVKMDELTASVRANGVIQPLSLARRGERYEVIAGHRRFMAAGRAGLVVVPAIVYPSAEEARVAIQFAENRHREDLNPGDEAIWFNELLERDCNGDVDRLCALIGEKRTHVENRLTLFAGDEGFAKLRRKIGIGVAQQLNCCTNQQHAGICSQAILGGATVAVASGWIADWQRQQQPSSGDAPTVAPAPAPASIPITNYFTCGACGGTDNVHLMQPTNFHQHCKLAVVDKALEQHRRRGELIEWPRTLDEAVDLLGQIMSGSRKCWNSIIGAASRAMHIA